MLTCQVRHGGYGQGYPRNTSKAWQLIVWNRLLFCFLLNRCLFAFGHESNSQELQTQKIWALKMAVAIWQFPGRRMLWTGSAVPRITGQTMPGLILTAFMSWQGVCLWETVGFPEFLVHLYGFNFDGCEQVGSRYESIDSPSNSVGVLGDCEKPLPLKFLVEISRMGSTCTSKEQKERFEAPGRPSISPISDFSRVISALSLEVPRNPRRLLHDEPMSHPMLPLPRTRRDDARVGIDPHWEHLPRCCTREECTAPLNAPFRSDNSSWRLTGRSETLLFHLRPSQMMGISTPTELQLIVFLAFGLVILSSTLRGREMCSLS